jgi:hypothetical protein
MKWVKGGLVFCADGDFSWMNSHAQIPTAILMGDKIRIFFSTRTVITESKTTYLDVKASDPSCILYINDRPILYGGKSGSFDEHGIMPSSALYNDKGGVNLYYSGWRRGNDVPYINLTGLAMSPDGSSFVKCGSAPILTTTPDEPYSATSPFVFRENSLWYAFYCSGKGWLNINGKYEHTYDIKYAISRDGIRWLQLGVPIIKQKNIDEAITRPTILKIQDTYHMWFCFRGSRDFRDGDDAYRIGYASSHNLTDWQRDDENSGIQVSQSGWDSKMLAYPYVVETEYGVYMFYNGNGFGKSGFGYAILSGT